MTTYTGKCLCGAVQFTASNVETHHHACHCGMCRRWAGGPLFATAAEGVEFSGTENLARFKSSDWAERGFCRNCGSNLFYYLAPADQYMLAIGSFEDASPFTLAREIFVDRKPDGYVFAGEHPRWTEAETLAHFKAGEDEAVEG